MIGERRNNPACPLMPPVTGQTLSRSDHDRQGPSPAETNLLDLASRREDPCSPMATSKKPKVRPSKPSIPEESTPTPTPVEPESTLPCSSPAPAPPRSRRPSPTSAPMTPTTSSPWVGVDTARVSRDAQRLYGISLDFLARATPDQRVLLGAVTPDRLRIGVWAAAEGDRLDTALTTGATSAGQKQASTRSKWQALRAQSLFSSVADILHAVATALALADAPAVADAFGNHPHRRADRHLAPLADEARPVVPRQPQARDGRPHPRHRAHRRVARHRRGPRRRRREGRHRRRVSPRRRPRESGGGSTSGTASTSRSSRDSSTPSTPPTPRMPPSPGSSRSPSAPSWARRTALRPPRRP